MKNKSFQELECLTAYHFEYQDEMIVTHIDIGTPVLIFDDGGNSSFGISAIDLSDKDKLWKALFDNQIPKGYGIVCGENRVIFRNFGENTNGNT